MKRCLTVSQEYLKHLATTCTNASTRKRPSGRFFFAVQPQAHTHTHTQTPASTRKRKKGLPTVAVATPLFESVSRPRRTKTQPKSKVATPLFESVSRTTYDHYNAVALCCTLTSQYLSHSRKASGSGIIVFTRPPTSQPPSIAVDV